MASQAGTGRRDGCAAAVPFSGCVQADRTLDQGVYFLGPVPRGGESSRAQSPTLVTDQGPGVSLTPRLAPLLPAAGRGSGEDEAQRPGGRVQDELAVGSPGRGGGLHRHPAVSEGSRGRGRGLSLWARGVSGPWEVEGAVGT